MKYKVNDLVYFDGDGYKGVGKVVAIANYAYNRYLVNSTQITGGHDGSNDERKQDLRELIKVGYRVGYGNQERITMINEEIISRIMSRRDKNLNLVGFSKKTDYDIDIIERPCECGNDWIEVWKREEVKEMTIEDIQKALGHKIKVVE